MLMMVLIIIYIQWCSGFVLPWLCIFVGRMAVEECGQRIERETEGSDIVNQKVTSTLQPAIF